MALAAGRKRASAGKIRIMTAASSMTATLSLLPLSSHASLPSRPRSLSLPLLCSNLFSSLSSRAHPLFHVFSAAAALDAVEVLHLSTMIAFFLCFCVSFLCMLWLRGLLLLSLFLDVEADADEVFDSLSDFVTF